MSCLKCGEAAKNKFCSRSCAASYNNRVSPKRKLRKRCKNCDVLIGAGRTYCSNECRQEFAYSKRNVILTGEHKRCNRCKEVKDIGLFGVNRRNPDGLMRQCKKCNNERVRAFNRERGLVYRNFTRHGLTQEQFNAMVEAQGGRCAICKVSFAELDSRHICIDHDHSCCPEATSCGKCVRGILCTDCNRGLGAFRDSVDSLQEAVIYLSK